MSLIATLGPILIFRRNKVVNLIGIALQYSWLIYIMKHNNFNKITSIITLLIFIILSIYVIYFLFSKKEETEEKEEIK